MAPAASDLSAQPEPLAVLLSASSTSPAPSMASDVFSRHAEHFTAAGRVSEPSASLDRWARLAQRSLGTASALVAVRAAGRLVVRGRAGSLPGEQTEEVLLAEQGLCQLLTRARELALWDLRVDPRAAAEARAGVAAFAGVALHDPSGEPVGVLAVLDARTRIWTEDDLELLRGAAAAAETDLALQYQSLARRRAEAEAQRNQNKFDAIFNNAGLGIALIGTDGWLLRSNRALQRMLGASEDTLRRCRLSDFVGPDGPPAALTALERLTLEEEHQPLELPLSLPDGRVVWTHILASVVRDSEERPLFGIALVEDTTQRRTAEEALQESQRQLLFSQRLEAVGRLAGGIAHDFNNLLTAIGSFAQLLQLDLQPEGETALYISEIRKAAMRAATLTRQLLAFSRQQILKPVRLSLNQSVRELESMLRRIIGENVELVTDLEPDLDPVLADPGQVEQVLMNLVVNARDAMPDGGRVTIRTRNVEITPEEADAYAYQVVPGRYACTTVIDTGHGMDSETLEHIFEPFFTTKEQGKGTGLGLSTVYGIVKQSRGYIWAFSQPGQGTTFQVYLPSLPGETVEPLEAGRTEPARGGTETLLLVEDEETVRTLAHQLLTRSGYRVLTAASGAEALSLYEACNGRIHLLLTDVVMPGMSGRTLAQHLLARSPDLRVVFMSGYTADAIEQYGVLEPGTAFLEKPFTPDSLTHIVRSALDRAAAT